MADDTTSTSAEQSLSPPFVAFPFQQMRSPFWQLQDHQNQLYGTKTLPAGVCFAGPDVHPHGHGHGLALQLSAPSVEIPSVEGRGVVASGPAPLFATRNSPPYPGDGPPHAAYSSLSSFSSPNPAAGLQVLTESPESSLLDPQASSPPPQTSRQATAKGFFGLNHNLQTETGHSEALLQAIPPESSQNGQPSSVYPLPLATQQEVVVHKQLFLETLSKLHAFLDIHARIPKRGGKELDLHTLYREVTAQGGLTQVVKFDRWKDVIQALDLPPQVSSPSFFLQKHYINLLHHYEQVYYFRVQGQLIPPPDDLRPAKRRKKSKTIEIRADDGPGNSVGRNVTGAIEGKFEHGYLVTVVVGMEKMRGVLYHIPSESDTPQFASLPELMNDFGSLQTPIDGQVGIHRRKRKGTDYMKRDPNAPRSSRSGYNFFFAEQRQKLKTHQSQSHTDITRMIGELWRSLTPEERKPYLQRGQDDKERYQNEKKEYQQKLNMPIELRDGNAIQADSESLDDPGHGTKQLEQDGDHEFADANDNDQVYHVSLEMDMDAGTFNLSQEQSLQTQMFGDYASEGQADCSQDQGHPISNLREQDRPQLEDKEDKEDDNEDTEDEEDDDEDEDGVDVQNDDQFAS